VIFFFYGSLSGIDTFVSKSIRIAALAAARELFADLSNSFIQFSLALREKQIPRFAESASI